VRALEFAAVDALINGAGREEAMVRVIAIWGITALVSALLAGILAGIKRRDHSFWAAWSFLVPPMLLILLVIPSNKGPRLRRPGIDEQEDGLRL
jgi:peptidoglycan/LPS O-acetylase OafA/YrhL